MIEIISESDKVDTELYENALRFYSTYLSKITQVNDKTLSDNISVVFDVQLNHADNDETRQTFQDDKKTLGYKLCNLLIKEFDKYCLSDSNVNIKTGVFNSLKTLLVLSFEAKNAAIESKF